MNKLLLLLLIGGCAASSPINPKAPVFDDSTWDGSWYECRRIDSITILCIKRYR